MRKLHWKRPADFCFRRKEDPMPEWQDLWAGKSFSQLKNSLPARPRYLGPGKWKKVLNGLLKEEEYTS